MTNRVAIDSFRQKLREVNADSTYSNQFLYNSLLEQAPWLISREISAGKIYKNTAYFQTLKCQKVVETSLIDPCCPIKTKCKIYRLDKKLPDFWIDNNGPVIKAVLSVDGSTEFFVTTARVWESKTKNPYRSQSTEKYCFFSDGYYWFPEDNPHRVNIIGFWKDDISDLNGCSENEDCLRFLDTSFPIPDKLIAEMISNALQQLAGISERLQPDEKINKNNVRK